MTIAVLSAASGLLWARISAATPATPVGGAPPVPRPSTGVALRPVPIPAGELVTALPPDAIGQVLCQALSRDHWNRLLGATTHREVQGHACQLVAGPVEVSLALEKTGAALISARTADIAGHQGEVESGFGTNARLNVQLVTVPATEQIRPYLRVGVSSEGTRPGLDELAISVGRAVVAATMTPGPALPPVGPGRAIPPEQVEPIAGHGIVDTPWPVISWQLCAALTHELGGTGNPEFAGRCTVGDVQATYTDAVSPRRYPDMLAGRPALITDGLVAVKLTDDSAQEVTFSGGEQSLGALAEHVTPILLGRI